MRRGCQSHFTLQSAPISSPVPATNNGNPTGHGPANNNAPPTNTNPAGTIGNNIAFFIMQTG